MDLLPHLLRRFHICSTNFIRNCFLLLILLTFIVALGLWSQKSLNNFLNGYFTIDDIKEAIFQINPLSSPGPDGFPATCYQTHWNIVGKDVCEAALDFLN